MKEKIYGMKGNVIFPGVDGMGEQLEGYCGVVEMELLPAGWKEAGSGESWPWYYDAPLPEAKESLMPAGALTAESYDTAAAAGFAELCETLEGTIRFYAKSPPGGAICVRVMLWGTTKGGRE